MLGHAFERFREVFAFKGGTVAGDFVEHLRFRHVNRRLVDKGVEINFSSFLLSEAGADFAHFFLRFYGIFVLLVGQLEFFRIFFVFFQLAQFFADQFRVFLCLLNRNAERFA